MEITIRPQQLSDAKRFFEILNNPEFRHFAPPPESIEAEETFLKKTADDREKGLANHYTILCDGDVVGGIGLKIDQHRRYNAEIGYFIDEAYWGRGITVEAVKLVEKEAFEKMGIHRLTIMMNPKNVASERVAIKSGYQKLALLKSFQKEKDNQFHDTLLYEKIANKAV